MQMLYSFAAIALGYILGSIPFGYIFVKARTGKDVRDVQSGRTGGTNVMRAAGVRVGVATGMLDVLKGYTAVVIAAWLAPGQPWVAVLAPLAAVLGHNYSIFMIKLDGEGRLQFSGGAGGATSGGGAMGLWFPCLYIILPIALLIYYFVGYASVTTLSIAILATIIFAGRAALGLGPWEYVAYGLLSLGLVAWSLRPNIKRLLEGNERLQGYRATHGGKNRKALRVQIKEKVKHLMGASAHQS